MNAATKWQIWVTDRDMIDNFYFLVFFRTVSKLKGFLTYEVEWLMKDHLKNQLQVSF